MGSILRGMALFVCRCGAPCVLCCSRRNLFHGFRPPMSDSLIRVIQLALFIGAATIPMKPGECGNELITCIQPVSALSYCHYSCHCQKMQEMGPNELRAEQYRETCMPQDLETSTCPRDESIDCTNTRFPVVDNYGVLVANGLSEHASCIVPEGYPEDKSALKTHADTCCGTFITSGMTKPTTTSTTTTSTTTYSVGLQWPPMNQQAFPSAAATADADGPAKPSGMAQLVPAGELTDILAGPTSYPSASTASSSPPSPICSDVLGSRSCWTPLPAGKKASRCAVVVLANPAHRPLRAISAKTRTHALRKGLRMFQHNYNGAFKSAHHDILVFHEDYNDCDKERIRQAVGPGATVR